MSNIVYINHEKLENVIISADSEGNNNIPNFNRQKTFHPNNTWWINDKIVSDAIIITDDVGKNTFKLELPRETEPEEKDIFKELLLTVHEVSQSKQTDINSYLMKKRINFIDKLKAATDAYHAKNYLKSCEIFIECLQIYDADEYPDEFLLSPNDYLAIKLGLGLCKLQLGKAEDLNEAIDILLYLKVDYSKQFPSLCYYLAETYYLLQHYEQAKTAIIDGLENIKELELLTELNWPGSDIKMILASDKVALIADLESLYSECKAYHKSDAICYLLSCPNKPIFFSNPLFNGYVSVLCSKNCNFTYHRECWKYKLKTSHIKKQSMVLESDCGTSDCGGLIKEIIIYDEKLNVNSTIRLNVKNVPTDSKWWIQKYKQVPKAKNSTEKPVPDSKSDKPISLESSSKCEPADENSFLISIEKISQVNNESKLNPFTEEFIPSYNQNHSEFASPSQSNLTESVVSIEKTTQTQNVTFVTSHTQTVIHTKEKQVQTVKTEKLPPKIPQTKDKQIQTVDLGEIYSLKTQINSLRTQLFEAEEAYNELLQNYNGYVEYNKKKPSLDCETQTLSTVCTDCNKDKELLDQKNAEIAALKLNVWEVLNGNKKLRLHNSDLLSTITKNQTNYEQAHVTLLKENENLKAIIKTYQSTLSNIDPNGKKLPLRLQNILTEQFHYISKTFMSYFSTYENKCKHMLWELQDLISLATYDSLPSKQEFEENFRVWNNSLTDCKRSEELVINFFYQLNQKFVQDNTDDTLVTPLPNLLQEPPNIMMRYFKSLLAINRKLEQDMNKNLMAFYKSPNASNASYTASPTIDFNSDFMEKYGACSKSPSSQLPVDTLAKPPEDKTTPFADISNSTNTTPKQTVEKSASKKTPVKKDEKEKTTLVGQDKLLQKIEQQFPLAPPATLVTALQTIRERHGGLTGRDFKSIVIEVKSIVKEISGTTKEKVKIPICPQTNETPPWKPVSNGVKWNNENPDLNCTICFDLMQKKNSVNLRCQHMFHRECIKKWLQTDSICPICRMFAILDDEFPPLK